MHQTSSTEYIDLGREVHSESFPQDVVQGHSTRAGREKGHLEWHFEKRS